MIQAGADGEAKMRGIRCGLSIRWCSVVGGGVRSLGAAFVPTRGDRLVTRGWPQRSSLGLRKVLGDG